MAGLRLHRGADEAPQHDPPPKRPGAPGARRPTIRERVDNELRGGMLRAVSRRPSEGWDNVARGAVRPAGKWTDRTIEAAESGADQERYTRETLAAYARAIAVAWEAVRRAA